MKLMKTYKIKQTGLADTTVKADTYKVENGMFIFETANQLVFSVPTATVQSVELVQTVNESTFNSSEMLYD